MFRFFSLAPIFIFIISAFSHAGSIDIRSFNYTDISQASMEEMLQNLDQLYGENIELKFHKKIRYSITSNSGGQAYVDPYREKEIKLVMQVPYDAQEPEVLATLCHEIGHLVSKGRRGNWIRLKNTVATEGQADFFVPSCMKLYMDTFDYIPDVTIDEDVFHACLNNFHQEFTNSECTVILQSFKNIFTEYNDDISYDKTYGKKAFITEREHPDDQCRLDTVKDSVLGKGRNRCWFNPIFPTKPSWKDFRFWRQQRFHLKSEPSLDSLIHQVAEDKDNSPFERGEKNVRGYPLYKDLISLARKYNTKIVWARSVSATVLEFPYVEERMKITLKDELEGWFDEFTSPNTIVLDKETYFSTLIHEVRHAIQLGSHNRISGNWFDKLLQTNKRKVAEFKNRLKKTKLKENEKKLLSKQATMLIENCSEINAHSDELRIAHSQRVPENEEINKEFIEEYKAEFNKAYKALKKSEISKNESFVEDVKSGLKRFLKSY